MVDTLVSGPKRIPVVMAKGSHLFPYRTQKLSLSAPMVLGWRRPGRVGHCRIPNKRHTHSGVFFICPPSVSLLSRVLSKYASTWLGSSMAARSACKTAMGERLGALIAKQLSASAYAGAFSYPIDNDLLSGYPC